MTIAEYHRRITSIDREALTTSIINTMSDKIVERQQERIFSGLDKNGNQIEPAYTPFTINMKKLFDQPFDRVTLKDTGDFYKSMFIERKGNDVIFSSKDEKTEKLTTKYGEEIFGLSEDESKISKEEFTNQLVKEIKKVLNGV